MADPGVERLLEGTAFANAPLRLFLGDGFHAACDLYLLLMRHLARVIIASAEGGAETVIPADCLRPVGLADSDIMLPNTRDGTNLHCSREVNRLPLSKAGIPR